MGENQPRRHCRRGVLLVLEGADFLARAINSQVKNVRSAVVARGIKALPGPPNSLMINVGDDQASQLPLSWVPTDQMLADELTKRSSGDALRHIMLSACARLRESSPDAQAGEQDGSNAFWTVFWRRLL